MSKDMDNQLKVAQKEFDVVDQANKEICVTLLRCSVDKPESFYAQDRIFARKKEDEKLQQIVYAKDNLDEFIYLPDVIISEYDKVVANKPICSAL